ncbi:Baseplate assembly protein GpW from prophage [Escherichia coli]|uniref:GPW/gp25 family protein n=1 Tax=Escherichia coli TaxID=562 RepID=UPI0007A5FB33|nr:GPW/gp25 family protein [Escherichia coli]EFA9397332.1 baseplate assembly protein [Escherichia coli]EFC3514911.1 baseplate assembly protein [Escherichia coli]EFU4616941.1 baseplate assembly protein [Escherichia coli]EGK4623581.1 baseplate assembly protein [Escherichia coli]EGK4668544.1 baseplate assembly protein [Escherichia coli]
MSASYIGMNPDGTGVRTDTEHLITSIKKILTTPTGSRVMRRNFGSLIPDLLDEGQNSVTRLQIMSAVAIALTTWEPRIALNRVDVFFSDNGSTTVHLSGIMVSTMTPVSTTINLES